MFVNRRAHLVLSWGSIGQTARDREGGASRGLLLLLHRRVTANIAGRCDPAVRCSLKKYEA